MNIDKFLERLDVKFSVATPEGVEYICRCPAHDDKTASLCVREGNGGKILLHCQAGCSKVEVLRAMDLTASDLLPDTEGQRQEKMMPRAGRGYYDALTVLFRDDGDGTVLEVSRPGHAVAKHVVNEIHGPAALEAYRKIVPVEARLRWGDE